MTSSSVPSDPTPAEAAARQRKERLLIFVVAFLGLLIVAGITAVVLRIIYLSSTGGAQRAEVQAGHATQVAPGQLALPAGASVKSIALNGDRLAVHYEGPAGVGIAVFDLASGGVERTVDVVTGTAASKP